MNHYQNPYAYRKPVTSTPRVRKLELNTDEVFAAACAAQRINGQYVKAVVTGTNQKTNRQIAEDLLKDPAQIALDDREQGLRVRQYFKGLTFKVIEGKQLSDFSRNAMDIAGKDTVDSTYELAVAVSLPASYEKSSKRDDIERRIKFATGEHVGAEGDKVTLNIEVLRQLWSEKYNTWYITGITGDDQVVFFAIRTQYDVGTHLTIQGSVKNHRENSTQLKRVKLL
jgi:hypothetical protein